MDVPVVEVSTVSGLGLDELRRRLEGHTAVFLGKSGVGKSSLTLALAPRLEIRTLAVSAKTGEGKHTTTGSSLYKWNEHSYIIDTPGTRSLEMEEIPRAEIKFLFPEFAALAPKCRYADCSHIAEPDCAIKRSLQAGEASIDERRYASYVRMMADERE